jgi:hypothetical protein
MVELKPCPRCLSPFVEHLQGPRSEIRCHSCGLSIQPPPGLPPELAVELWNKWQRVADQPDANAQAAQAAEAMIRELHTGNRDKPTRLERLVVAIITHADLRLDTFQPLDRAFASRAQGIVGLARAVEAEMDKAGHVQLQVAVEADGTEHPVP